MKGWPAAAVIVSVAGVGAGGTLVTALVVGMRGSELGHLVALLVPAAAVTMVAAVVARRTLMRARFRQRFIGVALVAAVAAIANLAGLSRAMFLSRHDATLVTVLVLYATGAGLAAALVLAKGTSEVVDRLDATATRMGEGDLTARVGEVAAGLEFDRLARTLDEMAARLQLAQSRHAEVEQMRRDLITMVSHDLRTPLASLRAMVEAISDGVVDDAPSLRRYFQEMRRSVEQLVTMVDDLFELTQLDAGAVRDETRRARLDEVIASAVAAVQLQASQQGLHLIQDFEPVAGVVCSPRLARVLQNLLANAVHHTPADGTVRITASRTNDRLKIAVEDSGEGISVGDLPRVFEPFFRVDPARRAPGAGLGLTLAKRIVEAMGGAIFAESRPLLAGSRFQVEIPISELAVPAGP